MTPFLLEENSAIGLVINAFCFIVIAPFYIGLLAMVFSKKSRKRSRGLVLSVGLVFIWFGAAWEGSLPILSNYYLFLCTFPLIVSLVRLFILKLFSKSPQL